MPVVLLKYNPSFLGGKRLHSLVDELPRIIADALDVPDDPDARLGSTDIEIWPLPASEYDRNTKILSILVLAHGYPARVQDLEDRKNRIIADVRQLLGAVPDMIGWAWVFTGETAFGRI